MRDSEKRETTQECQRSGCGARRKFGWLESWTTRQERRRAKVLADAEKRRRL